MGERAVSYVAVLPSVYAPFTAACVATCKLEPLVVIDNSERNLGTTGAWNLGIDLVKGRDAEWLVVLGASLRFGPPGGLDFVDQLRDDCIVVEAEGVFGWHLMAFHRWCFEHVGRFDENYFPYGMDDIDYSRRIQLAQGKNLDELLGRKNWVKVPVDVEDKGMAHSIKLGGVDADLRPMDYYRKKWGGDKLEETYDMPFGDKAIWYWPKPDRLGAGVWHQ